MSSSAFVTAVAKHVSASTLPTYVKESPADLAATLAKSPEVFVSAELDKKATPKRGQSKVGGKPDLPAGFEWPTEEGDDDAPLQFIAQINLAEVHPHDFDRQLPSAGMLWIFSIADGNRAGGHEIDASTTKVVFLPKPGPLEPHALPERYDDDEDAVIEERALVFGPTIALGAFRDSGIKDVIVKAMRKEGGRKGPLFMLGKERDGRIGLADFDMYAIARNAFGSGILTFVISEKDLKAGKLDQADTVFDPGS